MKILILTIILLTIFACNAPQYKKSTDIIENKNAALPADWKLVKECGVEFYTPSSLEEEEIKPYDSCAKEYKSKNIILSLDVLEGAPSTDFTRSKEYSNDDNFNIEKTIIDGRQAEIMTFFGKGKNGLDYHAVLDIPQINLTIWAHSKNFDDKEIVIKIFKSVRLSK